MKKAISVILIVQRRTKNSKERDQIGRGEAYLMRESKKSIIYTYIYIYIYAISRAGSMNLGTLGENFRWGLLLYLIINSYIFFN